MRTYNPCEFFGIDLEFRVADFSDEIAGTFPCNVAANDEDYGNFDLERRPLSGDEPPAFADNQVWKAPEPVFAKEGKYSLTYYPEESCGDPNQEFQDYDEF
ncbi:hypothetical protein U9M48_035182 [Paspalum notatum var. saurae]|uniref:Uncharacterized protein n=1 Tax=Paspalum notatum var. saurae TaxID=547442 RepID=A0AAQ3UB83_PASNO